MMPIDQLSALIDLLRSKGVTSFTGDGYSLQLGPAPSPQTAPRKSIEREMEEQQEINASPFSKLLAPLDPNDGLEEAYARYLEQTKPAWLTGLAADEKESS